MRKVVLALLLAVGVSAASAAAADPKPEIVWKIMASQVVSGADVVEDVHVHVYLAGTKPVNGERFPDRSFKLSDHPIRLDGVKWVPAQSWWREPQHELLQWFSLHTPCTFRENADGTVDFTSLLGDARDAEIDRINREFPKAKWRPLSDQYGIMTLDEMRKMNVRLSGKDKSDPVPDARTLPRQGGGPIPVRPGPAKANGRPPIQVPRCEDCFPRRID